MTDKTLELYQLVMAKITEILNDLDHEEGFAVELMISDFESGIISSMQMTFPNGRAWRCWYHYGQVSFFQFNNSFL